MIISRLAKKTDDIEYDRAGDSERGEKVGDEGEDGSDDRTGEKSCNEAGDESDDGSYDNSDDKM